ncbi:MAG: sensor histidine kinase [Lachnospiraceae bacterium]
MIYNLRRKFILISGVSIFFVLLGIFTMLCYTSRMQLNNTMDILTDAIAENNGVFPRFEEAGRGPSAERPTRGDVITEETAYRTRFFTVWLGDDSRVERANVDSIFSISEAQAQEYVTAALEKKTVRGWVENYRFKVFDTDNKKAIVFVNGDMERMMSNRFLLNTLLVLTGSGLVVLILIIMLSKWAVRPVAESYEKQKQFITDANHELKTPLTLILTNLDIVESEIGKNEWLDDMRSEGEQMRMLINQLVILSRMDEDQSNLIFSTFDLSAVAQDMVSEFQTMAEERQKELNVWIEPSLMYQGDEELIRRMLGILLDNAVKYCDSGGTITVSVYKKRHPVIVIENTYCDVGSLELERIFDRFYRADKSRTFDGSFGVGLSIARAIVKNHHGEIKAYKKEKNIGFKVEFK